MNTTSTHKINIPIEITSEMETKCDYKIESSEEI